MHSLLRERLRVTALAAAVVRDTHAADDIFQQVVLAALENRQHFRDSEHLLAWSLRVARHRAVDLARSRQLHSLPAEVLDLLESRWAEPIGSGWSDRSEALHRCVGRMSAAARELLRLKYADGLSASDIAARLRRTVDAVYQSLSRTHRSLRECIEEELTRLGSVAPREVSP